MLSLGQYGQKIARIFIPNNNQLNDKTVYLFDGQNCQLNEIEKCCKYCKIETDEMGKKCCIGGGKINLNLPYPNNIIFKIPIMNKKSKFIPLPNVTENKPDHILIVGQTGAGKSYFIADYIQEIKQVDNKAVFVFTASIKPEPYDKLNPIRVDLKLLLNIPLNMDHLTNSVCIFDDVERIEEPYNKIVKNLQSKLLEEGRKHNINVISSSHLLYNKLNVSILNEVQKVVLFKNAISSSHLIKFLKEFGLTNKAIHYIRNLQGRYILISKIFPQYLVSENEIILFSKFDDYLNEK